MLALDGLESADLPAPSVRSTTERLLNTFPQPQRIFALRFRIEIECSMEG